jgi:hypothetical protein
MDPRKGSKYIPGVTLRRFLNQWNRLNQAEEPELSGRLEEGTEVPSKVCMVNRVDYMKLEISANYDC